MIRFSIELAGTVYDISCQFASTKAYCHAYLTDKAGGYAIVISQNAIEAERRSSFEQDIREHVQPTQYSDAYLETLALLRAIAEQAPSYDSFLFHCSAIMVDGKAYLFTAPSGTGKSTHARLWREMLGDRAVMINDDKPFIRSEDGKFVVYGSPWNGKHGLGNPVSAPITGICWLQQAKENQIHSISSSEALTPLIAQCYIPKNPLGAVSTLGLIDSLLKAVPVYRLDCNISAEAAELSFSAMQSN